MDNEKALEAALAQADRLQAENRKLRRQMALMQGVIDRSRSSAAARSNLSRSIAAEKSRQEKFMQLLLENCPDIILLFDALGRFAYSTDIFLHRMNLASFGLISGRGYREVFAHFALPEWIDQFESAYQEAVQQRHTVLLEAIIDMDLSGNPRNYTIHIAPMLDDKGAAEGALALFHDMTEVMRAKEIAEQANNAKSDFLATVSHEIRTPMNAIMGLSDMLKRTPLSDQQTEYIEGIQSASDVLLGLINDILDFSKIEAGRLALEEEYFRLPALLKQISEMMRIMLRNKRIGFECDFAQDLPEVIYGDEKRIRQVLVNILNNAIKYTQQGGVRFSVHVDADEMLSFAIQDTGIGIKQEDLTRLFIPFEQLDRTRNKNVVGTGLGLAITHRLCKLMNGTISVESEYGKGSTFTVRLPLNVGSQSDLDRVERVSFAFTAPRARVLIVDDIEINLLVAQSILETFGIASDLADSGAVAVEMTKEKPYDLVFMDHMMPGMDGIETTQVIRGYTGINRNVPIVALTANAANGAREIFLASGFNDFLSKPINRDALSLCLLRWLPETLIVETPVEFD